MAEGMINVTDLSEYIYCQRKLFLKKVLFMREPQNESMVRGSIKHKFNEESCLNEKNVVLRIQREHEIKDIKEIYEKSYSDILKNTIKINMGLLNQFNIKPEEIFEKNWIGALQDIDERTNAIAELKKRTGFSSMDLWKSLFPKIKAEVKFESKAMKLKGIVDRIEYFEDDIVPFEIKTGSCPREGVWPSHSVQIGAYLLLMRESGIKVKKGVLRYSDAGIDRDVVLNQFLEMEVLNLVDKIVNMIDAKELPAICDNRNKCANCALRGKCYELPATPENVVEEY